MKKYKKYSNRKIYCLEQSKYVSLDELYLNVSQGAEVKVIQHGSEKDVTNATLKEALFKCKQFDYNSLVDIIKG